MRPHCRSKKLWRNGYRYTPFDDKIQRWLCCNCGRRFSDPQDVEKAWSTPEHFERVESKSIKSRDDKDNIHQEAKHLIEDGFEYVLEKEGVSLFRKLKQQNRKCSNPTKSMLRGSSSSTDYDTGLRSRRSWVQIPAGPPSQLRIKPNLLFCLYRGLQKKNRARGRKQKMIVNVCFILCLRAQRCSLLCLRTCPQHVQ